MKTKIAVVTMAMLFGAAAAPLAVHAAANNTETPPSVLAFDQLPKDNSLTISYAYLPQTGYVAVYKGEANAGPSGAPIGHTSLSSGDHRDFKVTLSEPVNAGEQLWISMYKDTDKDPSFDPGKGDQPVWSKDALPMQNMIVVR